MALSFSGCTAFDESPIGYTSLIAEAFNATDLEPVIIQKGKTTNKFVLRPGTGKNYFLSEALEWDKVHAAKFFDKKEEAENLALDNDYFIDIKN